MPRTKKDTAKITGNLFHYIYSIIKEFALFLIYFSIVFLLLYGMVDSFLEMFFGILVPLGFTMILAIVVAITILLMQHALKFINEKKQGQKIRRKDRRT